MCGEETRDRKLFTWGLGEERERSDLMGEAGGVRCAVCGEVQRTEVEKRRDERLQRTRLGCGI